jgi:AbrB family looped-hinge helix DNA binding protein
MEGTIDKAGRVVIPKPLRDRLGLRPGEVALIVDGAGVRIEPPSAEDVIEEGGRLVIPPAGIPISDDDVRVLRDAEQR